MPFIPHELADRSWRPERAVPVADALEALIDELEERCFDDQPQLPPDPVPLSTGLQALDRVLGGGVHIGTVTLLEADVRAQANALLLSVARGIDHRSVLDAACALDAVRWLVASDSGVPAISMSTGSLTERDWTAIAEAVGRVADRNLRLSSAPSLRGLAHLMMSNDLDVLLVRDADRFGTPRAFVPELARLAAIQDVAVLASTSPLGELPDWVLDRATRVCVHSHCFGGKAALLRPDEIDMLSIAQVDVECLTGAAR